MTRKISLRLSAIQCAIGTLLLGGAGAALSAPLYAPTGPQLGVAFATVTSGGWTQCFTQPYGTFGTTLATAVSGCTGDLLMMAGAKEGSSEIQLLAWSSKSDVLQTTAANTVHNANGVGWYLNGLSWGFAPQGFGILQSSADVASAPGWSDLGDGGNTRLSWHTSGDGTLAGTELEGGWRVGNDTFLNSEPSGYNRFLFTANSGLQVPEPGSLALVGLGLAISGAVRRRRRS